MTEEQQEYVYWNPEPGDTITGKLVNAVKVESKYKDPVTQKPRYYPILELETNDGLISVSARATVLLNELEKRKPKHGDELSITYLGLRKTKDGSTEFHAYRVNGGQDPNAWNWGSGDGGGRPQPPEPDVPIDMADFNEARERGELPGAPQEKPTGEQFGDVPF